MLQTRAGCPSGWSTGSRYQDNEDDGNANRFSPYNIANYLQFTTGSNFITYYCTKTRIASAFIWPRGTYCIAQYNACPEDFHPGFRHWDDEDDGNKNSAQGILPRGSYGRNTRTYYCCRSDGNPYIDIFLPPTMPFVLYRYMGICQRVKGMYYTDLFIHFDDEDSGNANSCGGLYPDGSCGSNQELNLCYYRARR